MSIELITDIVDSKSWICNYLKNKEIITSQEFNVLSRFGAWVLENHPQVMKAYWSYLSKFIILFLKLFLLKRNRDPS